MLRDRRLGQAQFFDQLAVHTGIGPDQVLDDGDPGRMGQGLHHTRELVLFVGKYFGSGQAHMSIVSLQYYDKVVDTQIFFVGNGDST